MALWSFPLNRCSPPLEWRLVLEAIGQKHLKGVSVSQTRHHRPLNSAKAVRGKKRNENPGRDLCKAANDALKSDSGLL